MEAFRYSIQDSESPYKVDPTELSLGLKDTWLTAGLNEINMRVPHIQKSGVFIPDGSKYKYDMASELYIEAIADRVTVVSSADLVTDFMLVRHLTMKGNNGGIILPHPRGMAFVRDCETGQGIISTGGVSPSYFGVGGKYLYVDGVIAAPVAPTTPTSAEVLWLHYWATAPALVISPAGSPQYPLDNNSFFGLVLLAMQKQAAPVLGGSIGERLQKMVDTRFEYELRIFEDHVRKTLYLGEGEPPEFSELGTQAGNYGRRGTPTLHDYSDYASGYTGI
jgi:hypothetical protein